MTAKYPVDIGDQEGIVDAVNYLLSGPSGLGQNFAGFSSYTPAYLTGNFRIPFTQQELAELYVPVINLINAEQLDDRTIKYYFDGAPLGYVPFALGNGLTVSGIDPIDYNSDILRYAGNSITQIGVVECTESYVIVRTVAPMTTTFPAYISGGEVSYSSTNTINNSTDCDVRVTVTGGTDRVFVSAQLDQLISYQVISGDPTLDIYVEITRFKAVINNDPVNPDFIFEDPTTITQKIYNKTGFSGPGTFDLLETVFTSVVDSPPPGYYRYIVEVYFKSSKDINKHPEVQITSDLLKLRSISAQVVKQ